MRKNDVNKTTSETDNDNKRLEAFIKKREDQTSALKKILEKMNKTNQ